jgi:hypothetical protein
MRTKCRRIFALARQILSTDVGSKTMTNRIRFFASFITAFALCSCSSVKPYDLYDVERSTRRLILSSSWTVVDAPSAPRRTGPQLKDVKVSNESRHEASIGFGPYWDTDTLAISSLTTIWPDETPRTLLAPGESLYIHVLEPVFFREGALILFYHRMSDVEIESTEQQDARQCREAGLAPYLYSDFRRITGREMSGAGLLKVGMGAERAGSQQSPGTYSSKAANGLTGNAQE